jgi:hypothetical protein
MVRDHQPGQAVFRSILPEDIDWKPFPAFPPSARLAVLVGEPTQPGPYLIRVKVPSGVKLMSGVSQDFSISRTAFRRHQAPELVSFCLSQLLCLIVVFCGISNARCRTILKSQD